MTWRIQFSTSQKESFCVLVHYDGPLYKRPDRNLSRRLVKLSVNIWFALPSTGAELEGWVVKERKASEVWFTFVSHILTVLLAWRRERRGLACKSTPRYFYWLVYFSTMDRDRQLSPLVFTVKVSKVNPFQYEFSSEKNIQIL